MKMPIWVAMQDPIMRKMLMVQHLMEVDWWAKIQLTTAQLIVRQKDSKSISVLKDLAESGAGV